MTATISKPSRCDSQPNQQSQTRKLSYASRLIESHDSASLSACYRLRHQYFVEERRWTTSTGSCGSQETDRYDQFAYHLAVFDGEIVVAYMRLLPWNPLGFMLTHEFKCLLPENLELPWRGCCEVSRLVTASGLTASQAIIVLELLFRLFYQFARSQELRHFFIVSEERWLRACRYRFGLGFNPLGPSRVFPDGTRTIAAYASLADLEHSMQEYSMEKFRWYVEPV